MGFMDKIKNALQGAKGQAKETTGRATNDSSMQAEGKADQTSASFKNAGENVKDAAKDVKDGLQK
jgi:uncharacterized protein YjbJ (UPF0337 family)